ncbi:MAG: PilZ domain-containing protein [Nitrospirae bacterium]|nr:PilZ domain-containing protein [Nitrospirota bacterium]
MAGFIVRKAQRLKTFATMRYFGDGVAGEGIIKDLSLNGSYITGNRPVSIGMVLALHIFVPGEAELLLIDRATVKWVKRADFGVDFDTRELKLAERITQVISKLVKTQHGSSGSK